VPDLVKRLNRQGKAPALKGLAHITGGGFIDNIPRVLPKGCDCVIRKGTWPVLPVFGMIQRGGKVEEREMYQVFNMGIGMVAVLEADHANSALKQIKAAGHPAWIIGEIGKGNGVTRLV
jgi:phosphoribosylformylglycinamidine cyclo-ligase